MKFLVTESIVRLCAHLLCAICVSFMLLCVSVVFHACVLIASHLQCLTLCRVLISPWSILKSLSYSFFSDCWLSDFMRRYPARKTVFSDGGVFKNVCGISVEEFLWDLICRIGQTVLFLSSTFHHWWICCLAIQRLILPSPVTSYLFNEPAVQLFP